ncbi:hypothetical protein LKMONMHP_0218 [Methylobacterium organophilum]|uniref:DRBM domain-containing protein n=2 Tax=Methylobacterium organophilum TaxID=410 RepID=A0ABQ4T169_METOR|nr:hypothetical protein LKMONMHP_0218 [Methylobacterium organophilum]
MNPLALSNAVRAMQFSMVMVRCGGMEEAAAAPYMAAMSNDTQHPYSLEISACDRPAGHFTWAIRKNGKLFQRADRLQTTEEAAERSGLAALEKLLSGRDR